MKKINLLLSIGFVVLMAANAFASNAADPTYSGLSARPLGMGKAFVAIAEDADAIFVNPAGLASSNKVKLTSMYTSLMGDVNYMVLGGVYPIKGYGTLGAGLINTGVSDIPLTDDSNVSVGTGAWNNSVLLLSYGNDLSALNLSDVKVGASAKFYSQTGSGSDLLSSGNGSGTDMDLGIIYSPNWISVAAVGTNILPGAKVNQDDLSSTLKLGTCFSILGDDKALIQSKAHEKLTLALDADTQPTVTNAPTMIHIGTEYWPNENLALRLGVDQDANKTEVQNNLTGGLGFRKDGIQFDYAYHTYGNIADTPTHYFSISFVGRDTPAPAKKAAPVNEIIILKPADKDIVYSNSVLVGGEISGLKLNSVRVNGEDIQVYDNAFQTSIKLDKFGIQEIKAEGVDAKGNPLSKKIEIMRLASFDDINNDYWAKIQVEKIASAGILNGYPDGTFKPERVLTRAEMATILARIKGLPTDEPMEATYKDVKGGYWASGAIEIVKANGLMVGYKDKKNRETFQPEKALTRAEGIAILVRLESLPVGEKVGKDWSAPYIAAANDSGILSAFTQHQDLVANKGLTRAEFCSMLANTKIASNIMEQKLGMK
jgi:hypothetical protein